MTVLKSTPCESCPSNERVWDEPPYWVCRENPYGDFECSRYFDAELIDAKAQQWAEDLKKMCRHSEERARIAGVLADDIFDALLFTVGARLDIDAFMRLCGVEQ